MSDAMDEHVLNVIRNGADELDTIIRHIEATPAAASLLAARMHRGGVRRPSFRIIDKSLQRLRRKGAIVFRRGDGWRMADIYGTPALTADYVNCPRCTERIRCDLLPAHLETCSPKDPL